ncbi:TPA: putative DNA-binding transcriptional regulator [Yersinia enterocolitica]|nr:putative DNA-binding transcriptional regulator [Yersinia enterocolitica]HEN3478684.1 putative DNA-binding transcriptional regulator [Yersinia enterocolitica]
MTKEWFSAKELVGAPSLPTTTQGLHAKARREKWISQRRRGVQGKAVEYSIDNFSERICNWLSNYDDKLKKEIVHDPFDILINSFKQLTQEERHKLSEYILREGIVSVYNKVIKNEI